MATYNGHNEDASGNILLSIGNGMTATLETGTTASQAYTKGAYLYYNNRLCKVTSAIASGNTLTIGTNIAYTSLGAELTSHLKATNGDEFYFDYKDGEPGYYPSASKTASQFVPIGGTSPESVLESLNYIVIPASGTQSFTAEINKLYLVCHMRISTGSAPTAGISSGATEIKRLVYTSRSGGNTNAATAFFAIVKATATTVTFLGTANIAFYAPLDI